MGKRQVTRRPGGAAKMSRDAKREGRQQLFGAALKAHQAKASGRQQLFGAAKAAHELKQLLGSADDGPMMIGGAVVLQFPEGDHADSQVPWDGFHHADGNFTVTGESVGEPTVETDVPAQLIDARLDNEAVEGGKSWDVLVARLERREARRARKEVAIERERQELQQMIFSSSTEVAAAAVVLDRKLARHEAAKTDYKRFVQKQAQRQGALRGDPKNIPARNAEIMAMTPEKLALPKRVAL